MAYKVFSNGNALNASELNTYLMNQSVISFASTTARDAALTAPVEGQLVWLENSNKYVYYTGSAWADLITPASSSNAIINGAFDIWQRGTSFSPSAGNILYTSDRWNFYSGTATNKTLSRQTFTPGAAPVAGYESEFFWRYAETTATVSDANVLSQRIEDVRSFAGQSVTVSFWAKSSNTSSTLTPAFAQLFGSGGSAAVDALGSAITLTTSWVRYSQTISVPSISGKTIGTSSYLETRLRFSTNLIQTIDIWGVQVEAGSSATAFKRNASNIQGELAACQRYYYRNSVTNLYGIFALGFAQASTGVRFGLALPATMRTIPTSLDFSTLAAYDGTSLFTLSSGVLTADQCTNNFVSLTFGATGLTTNRPYSLNANNSTSAYVGVSAEL